MTTKGSKNIAAIVVVVLLVVVLYALLTMPDRRTLGERIGDAADKMSEGVGEAAEELERRTPGEKLGDAVQDIGEGIERQTD